MTIFPEYMKEESSIIQGRARERERKKLAQVRYQADCSGIKLESRDLSRSFMFVEIDHRLTVLEKKTWSSDQSSGGRGGFLKVVFLRIFLGLELLTIRNVETILWSSLFVWHDSSVLDLHMATSLDKSMHRLDFLSEESSSQRPKLERN